MIGYPERQSIKEIQKYLPGNLNCSLIKYWIKEFTNPLQTSNFKIEDIVLLKANPKMFQDHWIGMVVTVEKTYVIVFTNCGKIMKKYIPNIQKLRKYEMKFPMHRLPTYFAIFEEDFP